MNNTIEKIYRQRLANTKILSWLLFKLPFVECVILNGSMATGCIKSSSDIDLLIIARCGRIFTARFLAASITYMTGLKRINHSKSHGGKFCLNYFLTDSYLTVPHNRSEEMNKYCAENYSKSILMAGDEKLFNKFMQTNAEWMGKYLKAKSEKRKTTVQNSKLLVCHYELHPCHSELVSESQRSRNKFGMTTMERLLSGKAGDRLEQFLKRIQTSKINKDPRTQKYPNLIVVSDRELRFHPPKKIN